MGRRVILTEGTTWLGGQMTSQAVPPDEHPWVERTGVTARYGLLRDAVRQRYKQTRRLIEAAQHDPLVNPGQAWVSKISAEPVIFREVLNEMMRPSLTQCSCTPMGAAVSRTSAPARQDPHPRKPVVAIAGPRG